MMKVDWVVKMETTLALSNGWMLLGLRTLRHCQLSADHQLKLWQHAALTLASVVLYILGLGLAAAGQNLSSKFPGLPSSVLVNTKDKSVATACLPTRLPGCSHDCLLGACLTTHKTACLTAKVSVSHWLICLQSRKILDRFYIFVSFFILFFRLYILV